LDKVILNLGCGKTKIPSSIGVDRVLIPGYVDVVHDLNLLPYPFQDDYADEIHFYHVIEHLDNPLVKIEEIHRILKPDGILYLRAPHFSSEGAFTDITHKRPFSVFSFDIFVEGSYHSFYTEKRFKILKKEIKYFGMYPNEGIYEKYIHVNSCPLVLRPFVKLMNFLINSSPAFFERIWCYWVGGACEVVLEMQKSK
jgi:SAM-dependent methyltransferase